VLIENRDGKTGVLVESLGGVLTPSADGRVHLRLILGPDKLGDALILSEDAASELGRELVRLTDLSQGLRVIAETSDVNERSE